MSNMQNIVDWFRKPPGQYVGIAIIAVILFLLFSIRYDSSNGNHILGPGSPIPQGMQSWENR
jgi:hypothetical protein